VPKPDGIDTFSQCPTVQHTPDGRTARSKTWQWVSKIGTIRCSKTDKGLITTDLMLHLRIGGNKTVQAV